MKICFWGNIGKALAGRTSGGGELQIALLARALVMGGHEVVIVDYDAVEEYKTDEGITVCPIKGWNDGIRMIRTFTHRLPRLYMTLRDQKADIYYCRIRDSRHIFSYWAARKVKAKFILGLASDLDIMSFRTRWKYYYLANLRNLWVFFDGVFSEMVYPMLLRKSDFIFVQHEGQKQILQEKGIKSLIFPNLIDLTKMPSVSNPAHADFTYVGWLDKRKGFPEFFELVSKSPLHKFKVIGPPRDKTGFFYFEKLKSFQNVSLMGELSHSETLRHIAGSKALISTSPMEGFPNIFIEAWAFGIPVLSLYFDPGNVISREELGEVAGGDLDKLAKALDMVRNTDEFASKSKKYIDHKHVLNEFKIDEIKELFNELCFDGKI
jgi:glycosyltransferase involved in cell wall biosynthesis